MSDDAEARKAQTRALFESVVQDEDTPGMFSYRDDRLGTTVPAGWVERYLELLGVEHAAPGRSELAKLTRAHLGAVQFENVSAILRRRRRPDGPVPPLDPDAVLGAWEQGRAGGVCFEITAMFSRLLVALGYEAHPVLGFITFLGSHLAVLVELDEGRFLADVGNGAPFYEPIPLAGTVEVRRAGLAYRFRPDRSGSWAQDRWIDGDWAPFCRYDLDPPSLDDQEAAYQRHHLPGVSWVVDTVILVSCAGEAVYRLRDGELTRFTAAGKETERVAGPAAHARVAAEVFRLPGLPIRDALEALKDGKVSA